MEDRHEKMRFGLLDAARNTTGRISFYKKTDNLVFTAGEGRMSNYEEINP